MLWKLRNMLTDKYGNPLLQYFDEENKDFKIQPQIATEETLKGERVLLNQARSSQGKTLTPNEEWLSEPIKTDGLTRISYFTSLPSDVTGKDSYEVSIITTLNEFEDRREEKILVPGGTTANNVNGSVRVYSPYIYLRIKNLSERDLAIAVYLYATKS